MYVIGTAGHVDHGKSTLIKSITGINPDRLAEEQEREMTIDLGFAWQTLPSGEEIGIVDVPGHRDFIDNMLAGVGGIDMVLFVVAADEGIMPQSREHLNIIKLLGIKHGVIVLTKIDLVPDQDWLNLVEDDVKNLVNNTFLANAPIVQVSATKNRGLDDLVTAIDNTLPHIQKEQTGELPRLPIDRVFSLRGFGTIVTGTLIGGGFSVGEDVLVMPSGLETRIRGIQTHKKKQEKALPGNRTAINLTGIDVSEVFRGDVLCKPDNYSPTNMIDIKMQVLKDYPDSLNHDEEVKVFLGTSQTMARVRVIGEKVLSTGSEGFVQLMLTEQVIAADGDRLIIRRPSPGATIGGGIVITAHPKVRHKRFSPDVLKRMEIHASGSINDRVLMALKDLRIAKLSEISKKVDISESEIKSLIPELLAKGQLTSLKDSINENMCWYMPSKLWENTKKEIKNSLEKFHAANPLKNGTTANYIQIHSGLEKRQGQAVLNAMLEAGDIIFEDQTYRLPTFSIELSNQQSKAVEDIIEKFRQSNNQTPTVKETIELIGEDLFDYLVASEKLQLISPSVVYLPEQIETIVLAIKELLHQKPKFTVADFRDHLQTSRKYAVALLEYMDECKITLRKGDFRIQHTG